MGTFEEIISEVITEAASLVQGENRELLDKLKLKKSADLNAMEEDPICYGCWAR